MSVPEALWRIKARITETADRVALTARQKTVPAHRLVNGTPVHEIPAHAGRSIETPTVGAFPDGIVDGWRADAVSVGGKVAEHRLSFFDLTDVHLGDEINWNYEVKAGVSTPMGFAAAIDYRDHATTGDCKIVWEPNRHHHLVTLGRAYRLGGEQRFATEAVEQLESWMDQCPYGVGMNWRSPLELGIRLINWVWTLKLIRPSGALTSESAARVVECAYRHMWEISRKYSRYSSANNHVVGEAAGVLVASNYFSHLRVASRLRAESRAILLREITAQTHPDGGTCEQAFGYHLFVLQLFLLAGLSARENGDDMTAEYWGRLEKMFEFAAAFFEAGDSPPLYGDCDDAYVLDLGCGANRLAGLMSIGAVLFERKDFATLAGSFSQSTWWLLGEDGRAAFERLIADRTDVELSSKAFPESGYYLLQQGVRGEPDCTSVVFDCGPLGFESIAAHGHADALSITLRVGGVDVLVDPGTYDYFSFNGWRDYFRSTPAHNTITIDGQDQSENLGPFLWGRQATSECMAWEPSDSGGKVVGRHDGYARLADPVVHRRTVEMTGDPSVLTIQDEIISNGRHEVSMHLHLSEQCTVERTRENEFVVDYGAGTLTIVPDPQLTLSVIRGSENPTLGWMSRGYHHRVPTATIQGRCRCEGRIALRTCMRIDSSRKRAGGRQALSRADEAAYSS